MKPTRQLIDALRRAATRIEDPNGGYNWWESAHCNCGILAQEIGIPERRVTNVGSWAQSVKLGVCAATGASIDDVFAALLGAGVEKADIIVLERDAGMTRTAVARYFRAQADILEEQLTPKPSPVPQPCVHLYLAGCCVYCSHVEGVSQPVEQPIPTRENPLAPLIQLI